MHKVCQLRRHSQNSIWHNNCICPRMIVRITPDISVVRRLNGDLLLRHYRDKAYDVVAIPATAVRDVALELARQATMREHEPTPDYSAIGPST